MSAAATTGTAAMASRARVRSAGIDAARGVCLVIMMINHLPGNDFVRPFVVVGYAPVAESFVFLAGISAAFSWRSTQRKGGEAVARRRLWRRSLDIYVAHGLVLVVCWVALH